jgi:hypothetical protein
MPFHTHSRRRPDAPTGKTTSAIRPTMDFEDGKISHMTRLERRLGHEGTRLTE